MPNNPLIANAVAAALANIPFVGPLEIDTSSHTPAGVVSLVDLIAQASLLAGVAPRQIVVDGFVSGILRAPQFTAQPGHWLHATTGVMIVPDPIIHDRVLVHP